MVLNILIEIIGGFSIHIFPLAEAFSQSDLQLHFSINRIKRIRVGTHFSGWRIQKVVTSF